MGNSTHWGNWPEHWIKSWHSTNTLLPPTIPVADLVKKDVRAEDLVRIDETALEEALASALSKLQPRSQ
ncbi:hypothetical protein [Bradyrhizobium sp. ERR14]|uniref:hypothetical protein n=1 Tax=Bradyrhizobium sp. ERR14 TaxID=2663837 RepID=UPI0016115DED|nr:hypothetical protein [Bradyrhizobium sp. ERR14]MBB4398859.1 hypothetical protein [Bradyrhizobium sp. ERR14]